MNEPTWIMRADAGASIGVGHLIRCLSLAEAAVTRGRRVCLVSHDLPESLAARVRASGVELVLATSLPGSEADGASTAALATDAEAVVVDGYQFRREYRAGLGDVPAVIVSIEDNLENDATELDVIVNTGPHARPEEYAGRAPVILLGLSYALLRGEILDLHDTRRAFGPATTAVVVMGGTDVVGAAGLISEAIVEQTPLDVLVMTGITTDRSPALDDLAARSVGRISALPFDRLPEALSRADVGVVAAGGTLWEAAALGLPTVAAITADNQARIATTPEVGSFATVHDLRVAVALDAIVDDVRALAADPKRRRQASAAGRTLVDGRGATRVVDAVLAHAESGSDRCSSRAAR
jgi:spore coat polysaccharide biosynthesis predicted glycosyltransferase SpsG